MKKYFSILVAVMFAALSFTLTSCGGDDENEPGYDESESGSTSAEINFTINGEKFQECPNNLENEIHWSLHYTPSPNPFPIKIDLQAHIQNAEDFDDWWLNIRLRDNAIYNGAVIFDGTKTDQWGFTDINATYESLKFYALGNPISGYGRVKGGKITITDLKPNSITLKFENFTLEDDAYPSSDGNVVMNGTITYPRGKNDETNLNLTKLGDFKTDLTADGQPASSSHEHFLTGYVSTENRTSEENNGKEIEYLKFELNYHADIYEDLVFYCKSSDFKAGSKLRVYPDDVNSSVNGTVEVVSINRNQALLKFNSFKIDRGEYLTGTLNGNVRYIKASDF